MHIVDRAMVNVVDVFAGGCLLTNLQTDDYFRQWRIPSLFRKYNPLSPLMVLEGGRFGDQPNQTYSRQGNTEFFVDIGGTGSC